MDKQIKNQFDQKTIKKIAKGALIAGSSAIALYLLNWVGTLQLDALTPVVAAVVPILVNAIKEWRRGEIE